MRHFKKNPAGTRVLTMASALHALAYAGLLTIAPLTVSAVPFASSAMAEVGNPHALANSNRDHNKQALADQSTEPAADPTTAANTDATSATTDGASTTTDGVSTPEAGVGTTTSDTNAGATGTTAATGANPTTAPASANPVGTPSANNSAGVTGGTDANTTTTAGSDATASATIGVPGSIDTNSTTTTRSMSNDNVSMSTSISRAIVTVQEEDGTAIGQATTRTRSMTIDTKGHQAVKTKSTSKATIRTEGTIVDASIDVATDGSAEAAITDGPSASSTSSAEATIGP